MRKIKIYKKSNERKHLRDSDKNEREPYATL